MGVPAKLRKQVISEINVCHWCGYEGLASEFDADHLIPRACGGLDDVSNLVPACASCNRSRGKREASLASVWVNRSKWLRMSSEEKLSTTSNDVRAIFAALRA